MGARNNTVAHSRYVTILMLFALLVQIVLIASVFFYELPPIVVLIAGPLSATYFVYNLLYLMAPRIIGKYSMPVLGSCALTFSVLYLTEWPQRRVRALTSVASDTVQEQFRSPVDGSSNDIVNNGIDNPMRREARTGCYVSYCVGLGNGELRPIPITRDNCEKHAHLVATTPAVGADPKRVLCAQFAKRDGADDCVLCGDVCTPRGECERPTASQRLRQLRQGSQNAMKTYDPDTVHDSFHRTTAELFSM